jgi:endo-1,4-beta-xylanase
MKAVMLTCILCSIVVVTSSIGCFADSNVPALKDAFAKDFLIGAAVSDDAVSGRDMEARAIVEKQFSSITPENIMKWELIHPQPNKYDFAAADRYVELGQKNNMFIVCHTLIWHYQIPNWVFRDANHQVGRDELLKRMKDHIFTIVGRYKGKIKGYDVVNEALNDDGSFRESNWYKISGEDFIFKAFEYAHEADPNAELYYNDYFLDKPAKRDACVRLVKSLQSKGLRIDGVGLQGHWDLYNPSNAQLEAFIEAMAALNVKVMITEMDIDVLPNAMNYHGADINVKAELQAKANPYVNGLPDKVQQQLAKRYADLFSFFLKHKDIITRVTFWGVYDKQSWLNDWPVKGRTSYPLLFDRNYQPKPAFEAVIKVANTK